VKCTCGSERDERTLRRSGHWGQYNTEMDLQEAERKGAKWSDLAADGGK